METGKTNGREATECCVSKANEPDTAKKVSYFRPDVDVFENDTEFLFVADIPGSSPESLDIEFLNGTLTMKAGVAPRETDGAKQLLREYEVAEFQRSFAIKEPVDPESAHADYTNGVLKVTLKKAAAAGLKKIPITVVQH